MLIDLLTLFPGITNGFLEESMVGRALRAGQVNIGVHQLRDWAEDKHQITDDRPYGGGAGMVLKPEPVFAAIESLRTPACSTIYLSPDGEQLNMSLVKQLAQQKHLLLLSGHYEGLDQRVRDTIIDREISIGDYVLTNGTLPAMVLMDAVIRYLPGVLGEEKSLTQDAFNDSLLSFPQYTRPEAYRNMRVPDILLSGNHAAIEAWRKAQQIDKTKQRRPDLINQPTESAE